MPRRRLGPVSAGRPSILYARVVVWLRWLIVPAWIVAAGAATMYLPSISSVGSALGSLIPRDAPAIKTEAASVKAFGSPLLSNVVIVQRDPGGLSATEQAQVYTRALRLDRHRDPAFSKIAFALPVTNTLGLLPAAREHGTTGLTYLLFSPSVGSSDQLALAQRFGRERIGKAGHYVGVTGGIPGQLESSRAIQGSLSKVAIATVLLIALIVGVVFRAIVAPLVTLFTAGISYLTSVRIIAYVGKLLNLNLPNELQAVLLVLLLGVVTDYTVFFLFGMRRRLALGEDRLDAARDTAAEFAPIIVTAGLTVAAGTATMLIGTLSFIRAFGPGLALTALVSMIVCVTLVPALLAIFGSVLFWPKPAAGERPTDDEKQEVPLRARVTRLAVRRPIAAVLAVLSIGALLAAGSGLLHLRLALETVRGLQPGAEAKVAENAADEGFANGVIAPTLLLLRQPGIGAHHAALVRLEGLLGQEQGIAQVTGPREQPLPGVRGIFVTKDGSAARMLLVLEDDPFGGPGIARLRAIQAAMPSLLRKAGLARAQVDYAGATALARDTVKRTKSDLRRIGPAALAVELLILMLFLRAILAPIYLLGCSVLALGGALGLTAYFFQGFLGHGEVTYEVPFAVAILLLSLGSDYNIFLVGRIAEEAAHRPLREAVAVAAPRASRAINVAAVVLAGSFGLLAIVPLRTFREFGFAMAAGVLLDAFLVRTLLVPALISLAGGKSGWPGRRLRDEEARPATPDVERASAPS